MTAPPVVLTIAGFDPSSGAGVTADIKTIAAHDCYGTACITALTVQSTMGVRRVEAVSAEFVQQSLQELLSDIPPAAIRIGMLGSGQVAEVVADFLVQLRSGVAAQTPAVVLDPILRSSSGAELLDASGREVLVSRLLPVSTVVTPNLQEVADLAGVKVCTPDDMKEAAQRLHRLGAQAVVVKGGHLPGESALDLLSISRQKSSVPGLPVAISPLGIAPAAGYATPSSPEIWEFSGPKLESQSTHGTGCAFATALACNLALGRSLQASVSAAKDYVAAAIAHAYLLGHGHGPMNHLFLRRNQY
jgi:hydroxymethylpyrimidine/phosphomethylpyrimidine kinase